eukprot:XP_020400174.1 uncharacterized protein LOC103639930 [Zea mays]
MPTADEGPSWDNAPGAAVKKRKLGAESGQLAVVPAVVSVGPTAVANVTRGGMGSSQDPWSKFCAGGEIASATTTKDVAASVAQQLKHAAAFAERIASGALTSEFSAERQRLEGRIECLRTQHTEAVRDKSAAENRSRNLLVKLTAAEAKNEDLSCRLAEEREGAEKARAEAQAARAEASLALKRTTDAKLGLKSLRGYVDNTEASTWLGSTESTRCSLTRTMLNNEEVEDFGGLESSLTRTEDAGTGAEEQLAPQAGPREDPAAEAAPTGEDPAAAVAPSQVAGSR